MVFLFHSWYIILGFIRNMKICFFRGAILVSKILRQGYSSPKLQTTSGKYMAVIQTLFTKLTLLCHICWRVCSPTVDIWMVSYSFEWIVTGTTCGAGNAPSFRNTWFHFFWEVHDLPIHNVCITECVSLGLLGLWLMTNDSGLFACNSLTVLSQRLILLKVISIYPKLHINNFFHCFSQNGEGCFLDQLS